MCGIAGVRRFGDRPITREEISILLCSLEHRGNHATGIAIVNDGGARISVHKEPTPAWSFVTDAATKGFLDEHLLDTTEMVLLHTRAATVGDPTNNVNNHPIWAGTTAVVHNGGIRNHTTLFSSEGLVRSCETDSDILRAILDRDGFTAKATRTLSKCYGSAAIAAASTAYPGVLALGRSGNPLVTASTEDKLYWASELKSLYKAVRPWERRFGLWMRPKNMDVLIGEIQDDTLHFIDADGADSSHHELKILTGTFYPPNYRAHETYAEKMKTWVGTGNNKNRIYTACRKCNKVQYRGQYDKWEDLHCSDKNCGESFDYLKEAVAA